MSFTIETKTEHHGWSDDPALLGIGCTAADNAWPTEAEALQALADLVATGFDQERLRVVEIDGYEISVEAGLNAIDAADDLGLHS